MQPSLRPPPVHEINPAPESVREALKPGEQALWWGQPDANRMAASGLRRVAVGIGGLAFAFLMLGRPALEHQLMPTLLLALFFGVGLLNVLAPIYWYRLAKRTYYAITTQRLLLRTQTRMPKTITITARDMGPISRTDLPGGRGTISIAAAGQPADSGEPLLGMIGIPEAERVEELLRASKAQWPQL